MRTSEVLNRAADLIEERGWVQGGAGMLLAGTPRCLEGAIQQAAGGEVATEFGIFQYLDVQPCAAGQAVRDYLALSPHLQPYEWNDTPGRTAAEVVAVLRACALIEAAREQDAAWQTYAELVTV